MKKEIIMIDSAKTLYKLICFNYNNAKDDSTKVYNMIVDLVTCYAEFINSKEEATHIKYRFESKNNQDNNQMNITIKEIITDFMYGKMYKNLRTEFY
jgi:hypothetical protein